MQPNDPIPTLFAIAVIAYLIVNTVNSIVASVTRIAAVAYLKRIAEHFEQQE